jgi:hypothetical protein
MSKTIKADLDQVVEVIDDLKDSIFDWDEYGIRRIDEKFLRTALEQFVVEEESHYFNAPDDDKSSMFCRCGKYITNPIHKQYTPTKGGSND